MPNFEVDYSYDMPEYATFVVNGVDSKEEAENQTKNYVEDTYPEARNIQIDAVREV